MNSPAEPRNSSYDVTKICDKNPSVMDRMKEKADRFRDFLSKSCCTCLASVPSFALVVLAVVLVMLLIAMIPLAFALTYWNPQALHAPEVKISHSVRRLHNNFNNLFDKKITVPLPTPTFRDYFPVNISSCRGFGFACTNDPSHVIGTNLRCDGREDCLDGSDELDCRECQTSVSCRKLKRLVCLRGWEICNGKAKCDDNFDEMEHCRDSCRSDEYKCANSSICIPSKWLCDGDNHCPFGDDEDECTECRGGSKLCQITEKCIPKWNLCDGTAQCDDLSDEMDCDCKACSTDGSVLCDGEQKMCMSIDKVCDGIAHCPDGEDETDCAGTCANQQLNSLATSHNNSIMSSERVVCRSDDQRTFDWRYVCDGFWDHLSGSLWGMCDVPCSKCYEPLAFDCFHNATLLLAAMNATSDAPRCIQRFKVCDGKADCFGGADEANCGCFHPSEKPCSNDKVEQKCFKENQKCDGFNDCESGKDEVDCDSCKGRTFHCVKDRKCIPDRKLCDGISDCSDESDEINCSCEECARHPYNMYFCEAAPRCFRKSDVCAPYSRCPKATQRDKLFCATKDRKALFLL